jgi:glycosyltransferase involved in cell wall biosynthesis
MGEKRAGTLQWAVVTAGSLTKPQASTFYRIQQITEALRREGHELHIVSSGEYSPRSLRANFDGIIVQKKTRNAKFWLGARKSGLPVVFDVDDAVWVGSGKARKGVTELAKRLCRVLWVSHFAHSITCSNRLIASYPLFRAKSSVVPMALDPSIWFPKNGWDERFALGWAGAPSNGSMLKSIEEPVRVFLAKNRDARFIVCSGQRPDVRFPYEFVPYSQDNLPETVRRFSVGLVPLHDNHFSRRKSPIKALQYMASAIPIIASKAEGVAELVGAGDGALWATDESSWLVALTAMFKKRAHLENLGKIGRERFERFNTVSIVAKRMGNVLSRTHFCHNNRRRRADGGSKKIFNEVTTASFSVFGGKSY